MRNIYEKLFDIPKQLKETTNIKITNREVDILACKIYRRLSDPTIAEILEINKRTVETHIRNITQKFNCSTQAIRKLIDENIGSTPLSDYYQNLLYNFEFKKLLNQISYVIHLKNKGFYSVNIYSELNLLAKLQNTTPYFQMCDINAVFHSDATFEPLNSKTDFTTIDVYLFREKPAYINSQEKVWIECSPDKTLFQIILEIMRCVLREPKINILVDKFLQGSQLLNVANENNNSNIDTVFERTHKTHKKTTFLYNSKSLIILLTSITFLITSIGIFMRVISRDPQHGQRRAEIILPTAQTILKREALVQQVKNLIYKKHQDADFGVPVIIISGIGGAGKTILARLIAHQHKGVMWELRADTEENLNASFKELAYTLIDSSEDRVHLNFINTLSSSKAQNKQIYSFVRNKLSQTPNWLLIFDDVKTMDVVKTYTPKDSKVWGQGSVIITTRDSTLGGPQSSNIQLNELSPAECLDLFKKVSRPHFASDKQNDKCMDMLTKTIPAFPLDIIVAASYMSYSQKEYIKDPSSKQDEAHPKEAFSVHDDYNHTRHEIITVSLNAILKDEDYFNFLLIISLLAPHNIPKKLLQQCAEPAVVNRFIKELKKYSLIASESIVKNQHVFSIHASIQSSIREYIKSKYALPKYEEALYNAVLLIERYLNKLVQTLSYDEAQILLSHIDVARKHANFPPGLEGILNLGYASLLSTQPSMPSNILVPLLEKVLKDITHNLPPSFYDPLRKARCLSLLGDRYRALSMYDRGRGALEESIQVYESLDRNSLEAARSYVRMGILLRMTGKPDVAKNLFLQSLDIYQNYPEDYMPKETLFSIAYNERDLGDYKSAVGYLQKDLDSVKNKNDPWFFWIKEYMAALYYTMGCYKKSLEYFGVTEMFRYETVNSMEPSLGYATKLAYVGSIYAIQGNVRKAITYLKRSAEAFKRIAGENEMHVTYYSNVLPYIGYCYLLKNEYEKAKPLFELSLKKQRAHYKGDHVNTIKVRTYLGLLAMKENRLDEAEKILRGIIDSMTSINHPNIFYPMEILSDLLYQKSKITKPRDNILAKKYKDEAKHLLLCSINLIQERISPDSDRLPKMRNKMKKFRGSI